jgi:hypothetical protein
MFNFDPPPPIVIRQVTPMGLCTGVSAVMLYYTLLSFLLHVCAVCRMLRLHTVIALSSLIYCKVH